MNAPARIRVVVADDHYMVREGLKITLSANDDIEVVGEAANGAEAVEVCAALQPDVVVMDVVMPVLDGPSATAKIRSAFPAVQVVALTSFVDDELVEKTIQAGAVSYLLKDSRPELLAAAVRDAVEGRGTINAGAMQALMRRQQSTVGSDLTKREREILAFVAAGLSNNEIAERLTLSSGTVRLHVSHMLTKLGAPNRTSAAIIAMKHGLT